MNGTLMCQGMGLYKRVSVSKELSVSIFRARILRRYFKDPNSTMLCVCMISIVLLLLLVVVIVVVVVVVVV
jgi:hypothetical protein